MVRTVWGWVRVVTWIVVLSVLTVLVVVLTLGVAKRQRRMSGTAADNERLWVKDPRDTPWGPSGSF